MNNIFKHVIEEFQTPLENPVLVLSLVLFIVLLSPILLKKLNIPSIIGLIISGVVIGKHGLNLIEGSSIKLFSTIGLLYIMFIAGLELDLNDFKINKKKSYVFGFLTFIIPISMGYPICHFLLNYPPSTSFLTASMFATHTLVAYPIVSRMGISKNQAVAVAVGGTILTDTVVLIILAVILGSTEGTLNSFFWIKLGISLTLFSTIMFLIIPLIAQWFFKKLESEKHSHYIFVLSVVFFSAFLAHVAGVEPIIGAFVAGLALNPLIPHSSALMNRIEFIGNALFIPIFLISVGMLVDTSVLFKGPTALIVAATLTIVALFSKWIAAWFTQLIFKYTGTQRQLIFGLSSAHAAATLAIILVGHEAKILDDNILNGTIILILVTCIVASFSTEKAARKILTNLDTDLSAIKLNAKTKPENILLPVANIARFEKLLDFAILIKDKKAKTPISILSVVQNNHEAEQNILKAKNTLQNFVKQGASSEIKINPITTIDHNVPSGITRTSREIMADMIIMGWRYRQGMMDRLMGNKVETILKNSDKTLFTCSLNKPLETCKNIVLLVPALAEREKGFNLWVSKITKLAQELSCTITLYTNNQTQQAINTLINTNGLITYKPFTDWEDILILDREINKNDLIILVSARVGSVSHLGILDTIASKLDKYFTRNDKIIIYPQQNNAQKHLDVYDDFDAEPIHKSIQTINKIKKGIGSIFR